MTTSTGRSGQSGPSGPQGGSHALTQKRNNMGAVPFAKTRAQKRGSGNSQADHRREHHMTDQHGRPWSCSVEIRSGMPTGGIANDFNAPWLPDQNALVVNPNDTSELWIDYRLMFNERMQALSAYHKNAVSLCVDKSWEVPTKGSYSSDIRRVLGEPPKPLQPVKAAAQENPWILGFTDVIDERLYEYVVPAEDRDTDLDDGEDYSPEGFAAFVAGEEETDEERAAREERELAERESAVHGGRAAARFVPPAPLTDDEMEEAGLGDFSVDDGTYGADEGEIGDGEEDEEDIEREDEELAMAGGADPEVDVLAVLDDAHDDGLAGRTVPPQKTAIANRQAPRRPGSTSVAKKKGQSRGRGSKARQMKSLRQRAGAQPGGPKVRTLADGAKPAIGRPLGNEVLVTPASARSRTASEPLGQHTSER